MSLDPGSTGSVSLLTSPDLSELQSPPRLAHPRGSLSLGL